MSNQGRSDATGCLTGQPWGAGTRPAENLGIFFEDFSTPFQENSNGFILGCIATLFVGIRTAANEVVGGVTQNLKSHPILC